jgi:uncharacterized membrane protein
MTNKKPNVTIENSIFIERSAEDIWNFLTDIVNDQQWRNGLIDTRWTSDEPSSLGSTAVYTFQGIGEVHWRLTEWEEQRVMGWDYIGGRLDGGHGSYRMEPEAGGTRMIMRAEIRAGIIFGIIMKFVISRQNEGDLKKLKAIMEE